MEKRTFRWAVGFVLLMVLSSVASAIEYQAYPPDIPPGLPSQIQGEYRIIEHDSSRHRWFVYDVEKWTREAPLPANPVGIGIPEEGSIKMSPPIHQYLFMDNSWQPDVINEPRGTTFRDELVTIIEASKPMTQIPNASQEARHNLKKGYRGDSISALIAKLERLEKTSKDEFVKTSERDAQLSNLQARPYRFIISTELNTISDKDDNILAGARYEADEESIKINLWVGNEDFIFDQMHTFPFPAYTTIAIAEKTIRRSYVGQNAFGAVAKVSSTAVTKFGLAFANVTQDAGSAVFSLSLPVTPHLAKSLKKDLAFYVDVELTRSDTLKGLVHRAGSGSGATISDPSEFYESCKYLLANLKEVGVYRKSTGEVLGWRKY